MPSARFFDESIFGITAYDGTPDQKITFTASPFDWLEASFFYTNIQDLPYPGYEYQDYKDKGFNVKVRVKEQGILPALAIGVNDLAGTGFYSGEYIVSSYELNNFDLHAGLGWGTLNGLSDFKNPLIYLDERFKNRPTEFADKGGQFQPSRYFSDEDISIFFGFSYILNDKTLFKFERDTTQVDGQIAYELPKSNYSYGFEYKFNSKFSLGIFNERDNFVSLKFVYKKNPNDEVKRYKFKPLSEEISEDEYQNFKKNLENNGIGVNRIIKKGEKLGIEVTQFAHGDLGTIKNIISQAKKKAKSQRKSLQTIRS